MKRIFTLILFLATLVVSVAQNAFDRFVPTSGTNSYTTNITGFPSSYNSTQPYIRFGNGNTGASTLAINGLSPIPIRLWDGDSWELLVSGDIPANSNGILTYDNSNSYFKAVIYENIGTGAGGGGSGTVSKAGNGLEIVSGDSVIFVGGNISLSEQFTNISAPDNGNYQIGNVSGYNYINMDTTSGTEITGTPFVNLFVPSGPSFTIGVDSIHIQMPESTFSNYRLLNRTCSSAYSQFRMWNNGGGVQACASFELFSKAQGGSSFGIRSSATSNGSIGRYSAANVLTAGFTTSTNTSTFTGRIVPSAITTLPGLNFGSIAGDVTSGYSDGDVWYNSTTDLFKGRANGATVTFGTSTFESVVAGDGITVDDTDPDNPIVSLTTPTPFKYTNTTPSAVTGTTAVTVADSVLIPAGTFGQDDVVRIMFMSEKTNANATYSTYIYVDATGDLTGATVIGFRTSSSVATEFSKISREIAIDAGGTTVMRNTISNAGGDDSETTAGKSLLSIDWTVDQYIIFALDPNHASDICTFKGGYVLQY